MLKGPQPKRLPVFELNDVVELLRREAEKAGGQTAWSKRMGVDRAKLNRVLKGFRPPGPGMIEALELRMVFTPTNSGRKKVPIGDRSFARLAAKSKPPPIKPD